MKKIHQVYFQLKGNTITFFLIWEFFTSSSIEYVFCFLGLKITRFIQWFYQFKGPKDTKITVFLPIIFKTKNFTHDSNFPEHACPVFAKFPPVTCLIWAWTLLTAPDPFLTAPLQLARVRPFPGPFLPRVWGVFGGPGLFWGLSYLNFGGCLVDQAFSEKFIPRACRVFRGPSLISLIRPFLPHVFRVSSGFNFLWGLSYPVSGEFVWFSL